MQRPFAAFGLILAAATLAGCVSDTGDASLSTSGHTPPMQWDVRPEGSEWTRDTLTALEQHDPVLAATVPADVATWCPGYANASIEDRRAFWAGLMSAVARYESTWNPQASGGGGRYIGIMQISPTSAGYHQCEADTVSELKDGSENLECAAQMMASAVARDGMVAGGGNRGIGRDWMPLRDAGKRAAMAEWTRAQPYCQAGNDGGFFAPRQSVTVSTKG
ncbi:transglycosylase SLT domain-containing protein [Paragemmobacter ruber]|uniref:Transglycosylase SLT domain-containing protein n=1 Tax=Paragemmobacter ruber TaxID=1985673 RepID=A0ABW9Y0R5_9RHOB|nr:transglycosylase SLT domain-containing protein [Rhodobacter ruber]NBE05997.1 transglycosylase SLT domain-containing protein [Rhodobacter ruber]